MIREPFEIWLETLKRHVATIEKHDVLDRNTMKFVFENAMAHLVLGWAMVSNGYVASRRDGDSQISEILARVGAEERANREGAQRVAEAEKVLPWWQAGGRFAKFVDYMAKILLMSPAAPFETIFNRLADASKTTDEARKIWRLVRRRGHDATYFAEAVARLVGADLKNVDVRDGVQDDRHNLSIVLGTVEKFLRDRGFVPGKLFGVDEVSAKPGCKPHVKKSTNKKK